MKATLDPAYGGLISDAATYCVTLGCQPSSKSERQRRSRALRWMRDKEEGPVRTSLTQKDLR